MGYQQVHFNKTCRTNAYIPCPSYYFLVLDLYLLDKDASCLKKPGDVSADDSTPSSEAESWRGKIRGEGSERNTVS